jgi:hypothetical protein
MATAAAQLPASTTSAPPAPGLPVVAPGAGSGLPAVTAPMQVLPGMDSKISLKWVAIGGAVAIGLIGLVIVLR